MRTKNPDQHMQLLSLISLIDVVCEDKEVLHRYLLNSLFLDSKTLHIDEQVWVMSCKYLRKYIIDETKSYNSYDLDPLCAQRLYIHRFDHYIYNPNILTRISMHGTNKFV